MPFAIMMTAALSAVATASSSDAWALPRAISVQSGSVPQPIPENLNYPPFEDLVLVTIGRGTQNYTCPQGAQKPVQTGTNGGAVAQLWDITDAMNDEQTYLDSITRSLDLFPLKPLGIPALKDVTIDPLIDRFPKACFHYFNEKGTPVFDCKEKGIIFGKKADSKPAPLPESCTSADATTKDIPWLVLDGIDGSQGFNKIIRIVTAGGIAPESCDGVSPTDVIKIDYAAQYWMFDDGSK